MTYISEEQRIDVVEGRIKNVEQASRIRGDADDAMLAYASSRGWHCKEVVEGKEGHEFVLFELANTKKKDEVLYIRVERWRVADSQEVSKANEFGDTLKKASEGLGSYWEKHSEEITKKAREPPSPPPIEQPLSTAASPEKPPPVRVTSGILQKLGSDSPISLPVSPSSSSTEELKTTTRARDTLRLVEGTVAESYLKGATYTFTTPVPFRYIVLAAFAITTENWHYDVRRGNCFSFSLWLLRLLASEYNGEVEYAEGVKLGVYGILLLGTNYPFSDHFLTQEVRARTLFKGLKAEHESKPPIHPDVR